MIYKELARYMDYDIPYIEIYNETGLLEYVINLSSLEIEDIDIDFYENGQPYGIIKLYRDNEEPEFNGEDL